MAETAHKLRGVPCHMPDLATRKATIDVPPGACDAHFHLFGPPERYPYIDNPPYVPPPVSVDDYRRMLGVLGIERAVIVHTVLSRDYQGALDALCAAKGRWRAIALPDLKMSESELALLNEAGFRGVRFNPYQRCWVKLSAPMRFEDPLPPYPRVTPFAEALIAAGPDRVVWASDWPHVVFDGHMPNDGELLDLLALWAPDPALRKRILVDNPAALYGWDQCPESLIR